MPNCMTHHVRLICPACNGMMGGASTSDRKRASSARNAAKAREVKLARIRAKKAAIADEGA